MEIMLIILAIILTVMIAISFVVSLSSRISHLESKVSRLEAVKEAKKEVEETLPEDVEEVIITQKREYRSPPERRKQHPPKLAVVRPTSSAKTTEKIEVSIPWEFVKKWFSGVRAIVTLGIIILFLGIAFLLKVVSSYINFSLEARFWSVAGFGIAMTTFGLLIRNSKKRWYGLMLQGAGLGILFLTIYTAFYFYNFLSTNTAFILLAAVGFIAALLSIINSSQLLAVLATLGAFAAPILAATDFGNHMLLFSYYLLINILILNIAIFKSWRIVSLLGFIFTFAIGTWWGVLQYKSEHFAITEIFLIAFFLIYVSIPMIFSKRESGKKYKSIIDGIILFGTGLFFFSLQWPLLKGFPLIFGGSTSSFYLSWISVSAALEALFFLAMFALAKKIKLPSLIKDLLLANVIIFASACVPFISNNVSSIQIWAIESLALVWLSLKQKSVVTRFFGYLLQVVVLLVWLNFVPSDFAFSQKFFVTSFIFSLTSILISMLLSIYHEVLTDFEKEACTTHIFGVVGTLLFLLTSYLKIDDIFQQDHVLKVFLAFFAIFSSILLYLGKAIKWPFAKAPIFFLLPLMCVIFLLEIVHGVEVGFVAGGWWNLAWVISFVALYLFLRDNKTKLKAYHAVSVWFLTALLTREFIHLFEMQFFETFFIVSSAIIILISFGYKLDFFPFNRLYKVYMLNAALPLIYVLGFCFLLSNSFFIEAGGEEYQPIFNLIDASSILVIAAIFIYLMEASRNKIFSMGKSSVCFLTSLASFVFVNALIVRIVHHYYGVPLHFRGLLESSLLQTILSVFWTIYSMSVMFFASKKKMVGAWIFGAMLLAVVVLKLFLVDLREIGTFARAISFICVGLIILIFGYFSPVPVDKS